jgi:putative membrane protein
MTKFLIRAVIAALGLWIATQLVSGLSITDPITLLLAAVLLGVVNAFVKPILVILTLPISILTLGLFLLVINAGMLALVALLLPSFTISGFFAAVLGAIIVSITGLIGSLLTK